MERTRARRPARCGRAAGRGPGAVRAALAALLAETDATNLVACAGIPGTGASSRSSATGWPTTCCPPPGTSATCVSWPTALYRSEQDVQGSRRHSPRPVPPCDGRLQGGAASGSVGRACARRSPTGSACCSRESRLRDCRRRCAPGPAPAPVSASPFHRIRAAGDALLCGVARRADPAEHPRGSERSRASAAKKPASSSSISKAPGSASTSSSRSK